MSRRSIGWILALVLAIAAIAGGLIWLDRESTLMAAARATVERSDGALQLEGVSGSLLHRIHVDRAAWRARGHDVVLDDATLVWSPWWLLLLTVDFHDVHVGTATVSFVSAEAESAAPLTLLESLRLPLRVRLQNAVVDHLTVVHDGEPRDASRLAFDGEAGWQDWTLTVGESTTPLGTLRGRLQIGASPPYPVDGNLEIVRTGDQPLAFEAVASGTLTRTVELNATLRAQSSAADASVLLTPLDAQPLTRIDAALRALDLRHLVASSPEAILDGNLTAASENGDLRGEMKIVNRVPGTIDAGRIPLASIGTQLRWAGDALALDEINVDGGDAGRMSGRGTLSTREAAFQLDGEKVNLHGAHKKLEPTRFKVAVETRGDLTSQDIRATFTQPAYRALFDATVAADAITVRQARVNVGKGFAEAKGSVSLDPEHHYDLKATLSRFDPSRLGQFRPANLNARIDATGSVQPAVQVRAAIDVAPSTAFGLPTTGKVQWRSRGVDDPQIAIDGNATIGETKIAVKGKLVNPQDLRSLDLTLDLSGRDLAQLYTISGLPFPTTPEYRLAGQLQYDDRVWSFKRFSGKVGRSDLEGNFIVDRRVAKPSMRADLTSQLLDMRDLAGFVGAGAPPNPPGRVLPRSEFHLDKLNAANADIRFTGQRIRNETLPIERMSTHLLLRDGILTLDPITFGTAAGGIDGKVSLDASKPTITAAVDLTGDQFRIERFAPAIKQAVPDIGPINGRVRLTMRGNSIAAMLATANGDVALATTGGRTNALALHLADLDLANALAVMARDKNQSVRINCLVGDLAAQDGVLKPRTLALDAESATAMAQGEIDLRNERLDLRLVANPKKASIFALRGPILVTGTFAAPSVRPDWTSAIARGGAAVALGVFASPLAAAVPFLQFGSGRGFECGPQVESISKFVQAGRSEKAG